MRLTDLVTNLFGAGTSCENPGLIEINGVVNGMICKGNGVIINPSGRFCGKIEARILEIAGVVHGDVEVDTLVIHSSGQLYYGKLSCKHLSAKDGSILVDRGESESEKMNDAAEGESTGDTSPTGDIGHISNENLYENPANSSRELLDDTLDAGRQHSRDDDVQEILPSPAGARALEVDRQEPLPNYKQPHFYSSY